MAQLESAPTATPTPAPPPEQRMAAATVSEHLGPFMYDFLSTCYKDNPVELGFVLGTGGLACAATFAIWFRHSTQISAMPISLLRMYYLRIAAFPLAISLFSLFTLLCPRAFVLCKMLQEQVEALTLTFFGVVLFLLLVEESCKYCKNEDVEQTCGEKIIFALKAQGPKKHFGVPPFGCCFRPLMRPFDLGPRHLRFARFLFQQYAVMVVVGSILCAWFALALTYDRFLVLRGVVSVAMKVSGFAAIWGLMILYVATHDLLVHNRTTEKFVAIKLVVFLSTFQELLVSWIIGHVDAMECVHDLQGKLAIESEEVSKKHREHYWVMYLLSLEAVGIALLIGRAFPAQEIRHFEQEHHVLLVDMELQRMHQTASAADAASSDSDGDEEEGSEAEAEALDAALTPEVHAS